MLIQTNELDHHIWKFKQRLVFNHQNECNLTLSNIWWIVFFLALKVMLLCSFHITQTQHNQISCKKERRFHNPPEEWTNWTRWSCKESRSVDEIPIQYLTMLHKGAKMGQERNMWRVVYNPPQPVMRNDVTCHQVVLCRSWGT